MRRILYGTSYKDVGGPIGRRGGSRVREAPSTGAEEYGYVRRDGKGASTGFRVA